MKKAIIFILISMFITSIINAQELSRLKDIQKTSYILTSVTYLNKYLHPQDKPDLSKYYLANKGLKFDVVGISKNAGVSNWLVRFWNFNPKGIQKGSDYKAVEFTENDTIDFDTNKIIFMMTDSDLVNKAEPYVFKREPITPVFGVATMPVKLRFGNSNSSNQLFDFSKDISLSATGGPRIRISHRNDYYLNLLGAVGISSITTDSLNTKGYAHESADASAFTWALGCMFEFKEVQAGIFIGWDYASKELSRHWVYQKDAWITVGLGYTLFKKQDKSANVDIDKKKQ